MSDGALPALMDSSRDITGLLVERITNIQAGPGSSTELQAVTKQLGVLAT